jgi:hypothetical protein
MVSFVVLPTGFANVLQGPLHPVYAPGKGEDRVLSQVQGEAFWRTVPNLDPMVFHGPDDGLRDGVVEKVGRIPPVGRPVQHGFGHEGQGRRPHQKPQSFQFTLSCQFFSHLKHAFLAHGRSSFLPRRG